jgi:hypothetical protein
MVYHLLFASHFNTMPLDILTWWVVVFIVALLHPSCPTYNGKVCNGVGICTPYGYCDCPATFSGLVCEEEACKCQNGGLCSPLIVHEDIPPSPKNWFQPPNKGWYAPECVQFLSEARQSIRDTQGVASLLQTIPYLAGIPSCMCFGDWWGEECEVYVPSIVEPLDRWGGGGGGGKERTLEIDFEVQAVCPICCVGDCECGGQTEW